MRIYNIYLDRIDISFDDCVPGIPTLEYKLNALSSDLLNVYLSSALGKRITYYRMSILIDNLVSLYVFNKDAKEVNVVGVLRCSLSFLRSFKFPDFQINILNHV